MEGGGCSGRARLMFSHGRAVNSWLCCCPGLPGFPRENIQRGMDAPAERHVGLFIEQVKRRGEERKRERETREWEERKQRRGDKGKWRVREREPENGWQSAISAADSVRRDLGRRVKQHPLNPDSQDGRPIQKMAKYSSTYWFMLERVQAEVSCALRGSKTEERERIVESRWQWYFINTDPIHRQEVFVLPHKPCSRPAFFFNK